MTSIRLTASIVGQAELLRVLHGLSGAQAQRAYVKAINDAAFEVRRAMQEEMRAVFDRPTDYILRAPRVQMARPGKLFATIEPAYMGGKGVDPQKILKAQAKGGRRRDKRSEVALQRAGILPPGWQTAIPADKYGGPFPGSDDGNGNLKGAFLVQLLSYLQAFGEQGYRANMTEKRKRQIHERGGAKKKAVGPQLGRRYIVAYGQMRGGARQTAKGESDQRMSNLPPGIWAVMGSGATIRAVLMFVRPGKGYPVRLDMDKVAKRADVDSYLERRIRYRLKQEAGL